LIQGVNHFPFIIFNNWFQIDPPSFLARKSDILIVEILAVSDFPVFPSADLGCSAAMLSSEPCRRAGLVR